MTLCPIFESRHLTLDCHSEDIAVTVDKELFKSMLYNLLDNAIKASSEGNCIQLYAVMEDGHKTIIIRDYGIGIPQSDINRVTEPFYMVDKTRTKKAGGAGLGLALCTEIASLHHADLKIMSEEGTGTLVKIVFREDAVDEDP